MRMKTLTAISAAALLLAACGSPKGAAPSKKPPKNGVAQEVHLVWKSTENKWKVKLNNGPEQDPKTATTTLPEGTGPTMFVVKISGKQVTFEETGSLTVWEGSKSGSQGSTQILGPEITKNGNMVFYDMNYGDRVKLYYSINLDNGESVDPIIENGGGTWN